MTTPASTRCRWLRCSWLIVLLSLSACNLSTEAPPPTTAPDIPTVQITYPDNDANVIEGTDLTITILANDEDGAGIARVELLVDEMVINERGPDAATSVPVFTVEMNWLAEGLGRHAISAVAYRPDGIPSDPATIVVNVLPADAAGP